MRAIIYLVTMLVFVLLIILIRREGYQKEGFFWGKVALLFLSFFVSFSFGRIHLPLGLLIGYLILRKWTKSNIGIKKMVLLFALFQFILNNYMLPPVSIHQTNEVKAIHEQLQAFEKVEYMTSFKADAKIQNNINIYGQTSSIMMFRIYVFRDRGLSIKDETWLYYRSIPELDYSWSSTGASHSSLGVRQEYIRFNKTSEEYVGFFGKHEGRFYLKYVIKGKLKNHSSYDGFF